MNMFKTKALTWWQMGIYKLSLLSIGVAIGATWPQVFSSYVVYLVILGVVLGIYIGYAWLQNNPKEQK